MKPCSPEGNLVWERSLELRTTSIIKVFLGLGHSHKEEGDPKATAGGEVEAAGGCGLICESDSQRACDLTVPTVFLAF